MVYQCVNWLTKLYKQCDLARVERGRTSDAQGEKIARCQEEHGIEKSKSAREVAENIAREFEFSDENIERGVEGFLQQLNEGLQKQGSNIEQLPSYIEKLPTGEETGTCLTVDLGGTNLRVCSVTLNGDGTHHMTQERKPIPKALMTSSSKELFRWVANTVLDFTKQTHADVWKKLIKGQSDEHIFNLGFTFSHAVDQRSIKSGLLIRWSKGFDIDDALDQDICALLQAAFNELDVPIKVVVTALINDTVGTLLAQAYKSSNSARTILGAVFGTGTNGAYVEHASAITKMNHQMTEAVGMMIMNTEWGNFDQGLKYLPNTSYDQTLDAESVNPGIELFEKRISGMYLGEILRLILLSLSKDPSINFLGPLTASEGSRLHIHGGIESSLLSDLELDITPDLSSSRARIGECLGIESPSSEMAETIRIISRAIARRSARLSAVAVGAVLLQTECLVDEQNKAHRVEIGVDGSLVELYPRFIDQMQEALQAIGRIGCKGAARIDIVIAKDGSGIGAALAAHISAQARKSQF